MSFIQSAAFTQICSQQSPTGFTLVILRGNRDSVVNVLTCLMQLGSILTGINMSLCCYLNHIWLKLLICITLFHAHLCWLVVVVEIFVHGAVKATVTNAPQSQLNKWVFSSFLNWPTVVSDWRSEAGRLFQNLGPATWKARSPKPVWVRGTTQVETSDERSRWRPTSETSWQSLDK